MSVCSVLVGFLVALILMRGSAKRIIIEKGSIVVVRKGFIIMI